MGMRLRNGVRGYAVVSHVSAGGCAERAGVCRKQHTFCYVARMAPWPFSTARPPLASLHVARCAGDSQAWCCTASLCRREAGSDTRVAS